MNGASWYRSEIDLQKIVDEQARKVQRRVDEATLDKAADTLADFGYVKVDGNSRWFEMFGTPERAMRTIALIGNRYPCDEGCDPSGEKCKICPFADAPSCRIKRDHPEESPLLEWLKGGNE